MKPQSLKGIDRNREQDCHLRHEKYSTQTADDTVNSKADDEITCACIGGGEGSRCLLDRPKVTYVIQSVNNSTNRRYGYVINNHSDRDEDRYLWIRLVTIWSILSDTVILSLPFFTEEETTFLDEFVTFVGYDASISSSCFFKLFLCGLYNACCRCRKCHLFNNLAVVLKEFDSVPISLSANARRTSATAATAFSDLREDFLPAGQLLFMGNLNGLVDQLCQDRSALKRKSPQPDSSLTWRDVQRQFSSSRRSVKCSVQLTYRNASLNELSR